MEWFKNIGLKAKAIIIGVVSFLGAVLFFFVRSKITARDKLEFELQRIIQEKESAKLEGRVAEREKRLAELQEEERDILEKIKEVEKIEYEGGEVSVEDIDKFFKDRGLL